ncbi:2OG-Fe(II) oxygenase [Sulfurimonas sp. SWIR-19]|uniref:2OG-Fe(II) oxygenase n=1 Tax=Sulfurimonas sp. SWIR-19 TaxID=2878390 RepID=UPI001CF1C7E5|nr:2OG-Fe(II) oxygenase [Sulfurimonas sp. SWIR-19]UCN00255.1 2OG-Fe(II) oxygenase [Sulfurimonas sp. SWIR-19]
MYKKLYSKITDALVDNGYIILENVFEPALAKQLLQMSQNIRQYKQAGISHHSTINTNRRKDKIYWIDAENEPTARYLDFMNGLQNYLNRQLYLGIKYYEAHFALYEAGDFYEKHLDAFGGTKNRVVTTVYYLNEEYASQNGGELVMYDKNDMQIQTVTPRINTLVVFLSEEFPHEVLVSKKERYSIAGWFRVDEKGLNI